MNSPIFPKVNPRVCAYCHSQLPQGTMLFCAKHYFDIPGNVRAELVGMVARKQNLDSKVHKCVNILRKKYDRQKSDSV